MQAYASDASDARLPAELFMTVIEAGPGVEVALSEDESKRPFVGTLSLLERLYSLVGRDTVSGNNRGSDASVSLSTPRERFMIHTNQVTGPSKVHKHAILL